MFDTYSAYLDQNLELKYRKWWLSSMDIALSGRFFANHNKNSCRQNRYQVVNKPR